MRTTDALMIGMALGRIRATLDAWEESKHPRRPDGKFGKGGGSTKPSKTAASKREGGVPNSKAQRRGVYQKGDILSSTRSNWGTKGKVIYKNDESYPDKITVGNKTYFKWETGLGGAEGGNATAYYDSDTLENGGQGIVMDPCGRLAWGRYKDPD